MEQKNLFPIGEVSKLFHISVSSLRHYENIGLLIPEYISPDSGYRYYGTEQFEVLNTIRYLRVLDMPLSEIEDFLKNTDTKRSQTDRTAAGKYDKTENEDKKIVRRVAEIAEKYGKTMTQVALAWQLKKGVTSPIIGATKAKYFDDAAGAVELELADEDIAYLEELYAPHNIVGALPKDK